MIKTLATCAGYFIIYTLGAWVIAGALGLPLLYLAAWAFGLEEGSVVYEGVAQALLLLAMFIAYAAWLGQCAQMIKSRPRGLGLRRTRQGWERY